MASLEAFPATSVGSGKDRVVCLYRRNNSFVSFNVDEERTTTDDLVHVALGEGNKHDSAFLIVASVGTTPATTTIVAVIHVVIVVPSVATTAIVILIAAASSVVISMVHTLTP